MKKKNLLLTLAMVPTMLLGIASVTSCGSTTRYNAQNVAVKRATAPGASDILDINNSISSYGKFNDSKTFNCSDAFGIGSFSNDLKTITLSASVLKEKFKNYKADNGVLILQLDFYSYSGLTLTASCSNVSFENNYGYKLFKFLNGSTGGPINRHRNLAPASDSISYSYGLALRINELSESENIILTGSEAITINPFIITPLKYSQYSYSTSSVTQSDEDTSVTYEKIGKSYSLADIWNQSGSDNIMFMPNNINAPVSKTGKKIIEFTLKKDYSTFDLTTASKNAGCTLIDAVNQPSDSSYIAKILEYPSTVVNIEFDVTSASDDGSEWFRIFLSDENATYRAAIRSDYEYDSIVKDGGTKTIVLDVDSKYTEEQIIAQVKAVDLFGVDVAVTKVSSDYVIGKTGTFNIVISATDSYGQTAQATLICDVRDYAAPTITQKVTDIHYDYGTLLTEAKLLENFELSDNMGTDGLTTKFVYPTGFDISNALVFGKYALTLEVSDAFGNKATKAFTLNVVDNVAPVISKKSGQIGDKIKIAYSSINKNTINTILNYYTANDAIDGACDVYLKEGKIPSEMAGDFTLKIAAKDKSGNEAVYTVNCEIVADLPPVFILSDKLVNATVSNPLDLTDLQNIVQKAILRKSVRGLQVNAAGYLATPDKVGSYPVSYTYYDDNNEAQSGAFTLEVTDDTKPVETKSNWFVDSFKAVFKDTKNATATQWVTVIGTFVITLGLVGIIAYTIKKIKEDKRRSSISRRRRNRRRW